MNETPIIGLSAYFIKKSKVGGAESQFYNLAIGLSQAGAKVIIYCESKENLSSDFLKKIQYNPDIILDEDNLKHTLRFFSEQELIFNRKKTKKINAIIYPNYFTPILLPKEKPIIATIIHDVQYKHLPQYFPIEKKIWLHFAHRLTLLNADKIITISKNAFEDIIHYYGTSNIEKIFSISNPISWNRFESTDYPSTFLNTKYILSVAHHYPHKNIETLIKSFAIIRKSHNIKLVLTGQLNSHLNARKNKNTLSINLLELTKKLNLDNDVIFTGYVSDFELGQLYANAAVFAFPSLFEGFGMPPVEALGFGIPTITTSLASIPEVTLGLAHYIKDPTNIQEWAYKISELLNHKTSPCIDTQKKIREAYDLKLIGEAYLKTIFS